MSETSRYTVQDAPHLGRLNEFTPASAAKLESSGIPPARAGELGILPALTPDDITSHGISAYWAKKPGMLLRWPQRDGGEDIWHYRPDSPIVDGDGEAHKYLCPPRQPGRPNPLAHLRTGDGRRTLLVEGNLQSRATALYAPESWGVVGMAGCWGWKGADLTWADGQDVVVILDSDVASNRKVWDAAEGLFEALSLEGALSVKIARLVGAQDKDGLDDVIGRRPEGSRTVFLERLIFKASEKLPKTPRRNSTNFIDASGLRVKTLADALLDQYPAAMTAEGEIALYRDGVYRIERDAFTRAVAEMLGDDHRSTYLESIRQAASVRLVREGLRIPDHADEPLLNCRNGMLDLRTRELREHDPSYLSVNQVPVDWDPSAKCPYYEAWAATACPDQVQDLEETFSCMLDPSRAPARHAFLFGPPRSGKSTFLRIATAVAGAGNRSAVTLHELAENRFKAANVYGMMLNAAADLSSKDVEDMSLFRMLTGEDTVDAERKHRDSFTFTSRALFAFSANDLPNVSEGNSAYFARIKPFLFANSFLGSEDPEVETRILGELPGILARLVRAWQALRRRGSCLETDPVAANEFQTRSNRVRRWVAEEMSAVPAKLGSQVPEGEGSTLAALHGMFDEWTQKEKTGTLGRTKFAEWLRSCPGVVEVRIGSKRTRGFNIVPRPEESDSPVAVFAEPAEAANSARPAPNSARIGVNSARTMINEIGTEPDTSGVIDPENSPPGSSGRVFSKLHIKERVEEEIFIGSFEKNLPELPGGGEGGGFEGHLSDPFAGWEDVR